MSQYENATSAAAVGEGERVVGVRRVNRTAVGEVVSVEAAAQHMTAWTALSKRALENNAFYLPEVTVAGLRNLPEGRGARLVLAWQADETGSRRLIGILPLVHIGRRYVAPLPIWRSADLYGRLSTPLLDPDFRHDALSAMLKALAADGKSALYLPYTHEAGAVAEALSELQKSRGLRISISDRFERAFLDANVPAENYIRTTLETRRRKEVERQRRRLAETGMLTFEAAEDAGAVAAALTEFLRLEAAGWKGKEGTAMQAAPGAREFLQQAAAGLSANGQIRIAQLKRDGQTIAAGIVLLHKGTAYYLKTCFDEALSQYSPGLLLTLDLTQHLLEDPEVIGVDSIAVAGHPMIDRVWKSRLPVAAFMIETGRSKLWFSLIVTAERLRNRIKITANQLRQRRLDRKKAASAG